MSIQHFFIHHRRAMKSVGESADVSGAQSALTFDGEVSLGR
jgi:hypothetical protein